MDEVRAWNVVRTASEIRNAMTTSLAGSESGLVLHFNFDESTSGVDNGSITEVPDGTSNANNGQFNDYGYGQNIGVFFPVIQGFCIF